VIGFSQRGILLQGEEKDADFSFPVKSAGPGAALAPVRAHAGALALDRSGTPVLKIGARVLYRLEDIEAFEVEQVRQTTPRARRSGFRGGDG
jgi:hypothetical protein